MLLFGCFLRQNFCESFLRQSFSSKGVFLTLCKVYKEEIRKEKRSKRNQLINDPILQHMKTPKNKSFSLIFKRYKLGTLVRNGLNLVSISVMKELIFTSFKYPPSRKPGFYMIGISVMKELTFTSFKYPPSRKPGFYMIGISVMKELISTSFKYQPSRQLHVQS